MHVPPCMQSHACIFIILFFHKGDLHCAGQACTAYLSGQLHGSLIYNVMYLTDWLEAGDRCHISASVDLYRTPSQHSILFNTRF